MRYKDYGIEDFVRDPFFQQWVLFPDPETDRFWTDWQTANPDQQFVIEEARRAILHLGFTQDRDLNERLLSGWKEIDRAWDRQAARQRSESRIVKSAGYWRAAAALLILMLSFITIWYIQNRKLTVQTRFSEMKSVSLPDGTVVDLNANSTLSYPSRWHEGEVREVWLEGEAFFTVMHDPGRKFIVHTAGGVDINVLGTTFNVLNRRKATRVSLKTGKIKIQLSETYLQDGVSKVGEGFVMKPGDVADFDLANRKVTRSEGTVSKFDLWKNKKIVFDNTAMNDVAMMIEETYGLEVVLDKSLEARKITGEFASDDLSILLSFIERALDARVTRTERQIRFDKR